MAFQSIWYFTDIPNKIIDIIEEDLKENFDPQLQDSKVGGGDYGTVDKDKRNARNAMPVAGIAEAKLWAEGRLASAQPTLRLEPKSRPLGRLIR